MKNIDKKHTNQRILPVIASLIGVLLLSLCSLAVKTQIVTAQNKSAPPGTRPNTFPPGNPKIGQPLAITPVITQTGNITLAIDGLGTLNSTGTVDIQKPAGATVRAAYLAAASTGFSMRTLVNGDVKINGSDVIFTSTVPSTISSSNSFGNVTAIVKPIIDAAPAGIVSLTITEVSTLGIDGEILAVVFDDPNQTTVNTVFILFGAQNIAGDTFNITTSAPIDPSKPIDLSLGISYSFQHPSLAISQDSIVNVNGTRLTSSAGGHDDTDVVVVDNGSLLTVGGIGDTNANPPPFVTNGGNHRTDDELYDLRPFLTAGTTNISVFTQNPSNDDNIFFAAFFLKDATGTIGGDCTLTCPTNIVVSSAGELCSAVVTYPPPTTTGTCGAVTCSPTSGSVFPRGTTTVSCSAPGPPQQTCTFTVTVNDTQSPTITCPANQTAANTTNQCGAVVSFPAPTVSDNCSGVGTPVCSPASGSFFPKGTTTVTCNVADSSGLTATCTFTVTINDTQQPTITCPPNQTATSSGGNVNVTYPAPTVSDNCPGVGAPSCAPASGSSFPVGTTTVTCTVIDASANLNSCQFTVTVGGAACSLICPANITRSNDPNQCGAVTTYAAPTPVNNCGTISCTPASGSFFPVGTTTVTCTASAGATCTFTVTVNNTQALSITCPPSIVRIGAPICGNQNGSVVTYPAPIVSGNCSAGATVVCSPASGTIFPTGTTTVTCTVTGPSNVTATCSFTVKLFNACVQDRANPNAVLAWNTNTGEYIFCCNGSIFTGVGQVQVVGCIYTIDHTPVGRRVHGQVDFTTFRGEGFLQTPSGTARCSISDDDVRNNDCSCTGGIPPSESRSK